MKLEEQSKILEKFYYELFYGQEDMPKEFKRILDENWNELLNG